MRSGRRSVKRTPNTASSPGACTAKPCRVPASTMPARSRAPMRAQAVVDARLRQHVERRAAGRRAHRIAVQRVGRPDDVGARARPRVEHRHHVGAAGDRRQRKAAAHRLAVAREVGHDAVVLLRAAPRDAEAGDDLVEDEHDAVPARHLAHAPRGSRARAAARAAAARRSPRRARARGARSSRPRAAVSLNGATSTVSPACGGTPTESGFARG